MSEKRRGNCNETGPWEAICTDHPGHRYSHYDSGKDTSWQDDWKDDTPPAGGGTYIDESEADGRKLAAAILTRRLRKCIAEGAHQPDATQRCPRCGMPQAAAELQPHGQPPTETTTTTEGRTDTCHGPEWETPQRTTPPRSPSSNTSLLTKGL
ncbi:UNVERIFIED_ORG: hypothetical protein ABID57_001296 [Arthrobacter sp. UYEF1]